MFLGSLKGKVKDVFTGTCHPEVVCVFIYKTSVRAHDGDGDRRICCSWRRWCVVFEIDPFWGEGFLDLIFTASKGWMEDIHSLEHKHFSFLSGE